MFSPIKVNKAENIQIFKNTIKFEYDWIVNHNTLPSGAFGAEVSSPEFPNRTISEITWYLTITHCDFSDDEYLIFDLKLTLASCNVKELKADYKFTVFDELGNPSTDFPHTLLSHVFMQKEPENATEYDELGGPFSSSGIHIRCEIVLSNSQFEPTQSIPRKLVDSKFTFAAELQIIFENEKFSDITFSANGKELKLHKVILAARSPVFQAMFEHEMMEKTHNRVEITDIEFDVLRELMSYVYTGNVTNLEQKTKELLVAADKYAIEKLKAECEIVLCEQVSTETVVEMYIFADTLNLVKLKDKAKNFIIANAKDVSDTPQWKSMIYTHPQLLAEAFLAMAKMISEEDENIKKIIHNK